MNRPFTTALTFLFDLLAPPRPTEALVRTLSLDDLSNYSHESGALAYRDPSVRALVWELKYHANPHAAALAGEYLSDELLATAAEGIGKPLLIPVPMHSERRRERGYNQTELLCEAALVHLGEAFEYAPHTLERVRNTPPQQGLPKHLRLKNIKKSMQIKNPARVVGRVCVVVDDVSTTGATSAEATRVLRAAGAAAVHCLSLARS